MIKATCRYATVVLAAAFFAPIMSSQQEVEAAQTAHQGNTVIWTTTALRMPEVEKHNDVCARTPGYMDGAICYRVCGGGLTAPPVRRQLQWRVANKGHDTPFVDCSDAEGCRIGAVEYYPGNQRGCVTAMIWKAQSGDAKNRDLRVIQYLK